MTIHQSTLEHYSAHSERIGFRRSDAVVDEARRAGRQTAFLSHSHRDASLAKGVQGFLRAQGWDVYIDWEDTSMPETPDKRTAERIKQRIVELDWFLFLATANSKRSKWCPWELGYADGKKPHRSILILTTRDSIGKSYGNEYLQLYRYVSSTEFGSYATFDAARRDGGVQLKAMAR